MGQRIIEIDIMRIAIFCSSFKLGGVERALINLANSLSRLGCKVQFVVSTDEGILKSELSTEIQIINLNCSKLRLSFWKLFKYIRKSKAEMLITGPTYPNIIAIICNLLAWNKLKIIATQHSYHDVEMKSLGLVGKLAPWFIKLTYKFSHKIIAVSKGVKNDLIRSYNIEANKIEVIYNAVISDEFYNRSQESIDPHLLNKISSAEYLVAVGRLEYVKNYPFLINIYSRLITEYPNFQYDLVILGDGGEKENLIKLVNHLDIESRVHILGAVSNPLPIISKAKLMVHTSYSEAMPLVYVEALALNVPVLTTVNKGAEEVLEGIQQKIIVDQGDETEFIKGILELIDGCDFSIKPNLEKYNTTEIAKSFLAIK